jgi:hypothetical protein
MERLPRRSAARLLIKIQDEIDPQIRIATPDGDFWMGSDSAARSLKQAFLLGRSTPSMRHIGNHPNCPLSGLKRLFGLSARMSLAGGASGCARERPSNRVAERL